MRTLQLMAAIGLVSILASGVWAQPPGRQGTGRGLQRRERQRMMVASSQPALDNVEKNRPSCPYRDQTWAAGQRMGRGYRSQGCIWNDRSRGAVTSRPAREFGGRGARWGCGRRGPGRGADGRAGSPAGAGMSAQEHEPIWRLLRDHDLIQREIRELPDGVETTTTTPSAELADVLRRHVRQMADRLEAGRPVRLWDPVFRDVFEHASAIEIDVTDLPDGVRVRETSANPEVVPLIQKHARALNEFVARGHAAARPPWAGPRR